MPKYLKLEIPNSCHEDWQTMQPEERGRFCLSCQKKVVDFTHMSDRELTQYFQHLNGSTCGRFTASQLNRDMAIPRKPLPWIKYFFQATLPAFLFSLKASAQVNKAAYPMHISPREKVSKDTSIEGTTITVEGVILDDRGYGIPHATIMLKGTNRGVAADSEGKYILKDIHTPATLVISSVGFQMQEVIVQPGQNRLELKLQLSPALTGEVVVVMGYALKKKSRQKEKVTKSKLQEEKSKIMVYPNPSPAGSVLTLQCKKLDYGSYSLVFYNISGAQVHSANLDYTKAMSRIQVQAPHLPAGTYFLKLTHNKKGISFTEQILITQ